MLVSIVDPDDTGNVNIEFLLKKFSCNVQFIYFCLSYYVFNFKNLTEQAIKLIVEKLILALFYNNMSLKGAFDCFDLNSNGIISKNEFFYGINSLELGIYK